MPEPVVTTRTRILNLLRSVFKLSFAERFILKRSLKDPGSFSAKLVPNNYQYDEGTIRMASRNGVNYKLDLHDYVDWCLYFGFTDPGRDKLYQLVKPGALVVDVGTNVGETLLNFAKLTGPSGKVFGFEPDDHNYKRCCDNLALNPELKNIKVSKVGLGSRASMAALKVDTETNRSGNRITSSASPDSLPVQIITLDGFADENQLKKIDLIKIDVEGYEFNVLLGAERTLKECRPVLFIELNDANLREQGHSAAELIRLLKSHHYSICDAESGKTMDETMDFSRCHRDIVCVP